MPRIYKVIDKSDPERPRQMAVKANTAGQALLAAFPDRFEVKSATALDIAEMPAGATILDATKSLDSTEPATAEPGVPAE